MSGVQYHVWDDEAKALRPLVDEVEVDLVAAAIFDLHPGKPKWADLTSSRAAEHYRTIARTAIAALDAYRARGAT